MNKVSGPKTRSARPLYVGLAFAQAAACASSPPSAANRDPTDVAMNYNENAKRRLKRATPVVKNGTRYEELRDARERGFSQSGGILAAYNDQTNAELWTLQLYTVTFDESEERDVQEVHISKLSKAFFRNVLKVENERGEHFEVDLASRSVVKK